jgi:arginine/ornithine transport system permease protein
MNFAVLFEAQNLALFGTGILTTLTLLFASLVVGAVMALVFALLLTGPWTPLRWLVGAYTYVIRGTPLLIQVYLIYYGWVSWSGFKRAGTACGPGRTSRTRFFVRCWPLP